MAKIMTKEGKEWLPVELTEKEVREAGKVLAESVRRVAEAKAQLDTFKKQTNSKIAAAESEGEIARERIASEVEYRNVDVEIRFDREAGTTTIVRKDNGEIVRERAITEEERQLELEVK